MRSKRLNRKKRTSWVHLGARGQLQRGRGFVADVPVVRGLCGFGSALALQSRVLHANHTDDSITLMMHKRHDNTSLPPVA